MPSSVMDVRRGMLEEKYVTELKECLIYSCPEVVSTYISGGGIPSYVKDKMKLQLLETLTERGDTFLQEIEIKGQLAKMSFELNGNHYEWDESFLTNANCIKLIDACKEYEINSPKERAFFLGQIFVETGGGKKYIEKIGGNYRLLDEEFDINLAESYFEEKYPNGQNMGYYFTCNNLTEDFIRQIPVGNVQESLFNNTDIVVYRGGGALQTTFKENYYRFAHEIENRNPEAAQDIRENGVYSHWITDEYCFISAGWDYTVNKMINLSDYDENQSVDEIVQAITEKVNGGSNGLAERQEATKALLEVLE